ncbi:iron-sulfur cluster assembly scaffold protein [Borrelia coriaceae]|uniref:NifU-like protein n=1 Tax=Borrelia coriaceae ATCC 43381 TaxID=1408429 RepID=W5STH1_9SPIR|nr:iron-sulfur cluster assembly scaffold protein [Borrelia coriaceae]AHH10240.1 NifU-like protein [Borrelia coriaceae ATCC 43381]UPA15962.1 iron-sulfur cluster assembly scaffold protein [Borrelia coriaceae]
MFSEETKKELIKLSKIKKYYFKADNNQNTVYHQSKCGDKITFQINENIERIRLKYNAYGCIVFLSSAYVLTKICDNKPKKTILDIITKITNNKFKNLEEINQSLKNFENFLYTNRKDCFILPYKALKEILDTIK